MVEKIFSLSHVAEVKIAKFSDVSKLFVELLRLYFTIENNFIMDLEPILKYDSIIYNPKPG